MKVLDIGGGYLGVDGVRGDDGRFFGGGSVVGVEIGSGEDGEEGETTRSIA